MIRNVIFSCTYDVTNKKILLLSGGRGCMFAPPAVCGIAVPPRVSVPCKSLAIRRPTQQASAPVFTQTHTHTRMARKTRLVWDSHRNAQSGCMG